MRRAGKILLLLLLALLLLPPAGLAIFLATVDGAWLGRQASALLSAPGQRVEIGRITGLVHLRVDRLALADARGTWVEATGLAADWHPLALLRRRLAIDRLAADRIAWHRAPQDEGQKGEGQKGESQSSILPALPLDIEVADLAVARLEAGPGAARLAGRLQVKRGWRDAALTLDAVRLDAPGSARIALEAPQGLDRFTLALHAEEPPGGLLANALDLPGRPAIRLDLQGGGPASGWHGRLQAEATGLADLAGPVTVAGPALGFDLVGHLAGPLPGSVPARLAPLLAGELRLAGAVRREGERILLEQVRIASPAAALTASGQLQPTLDLQTTGSLADLAPLAGLPGRAEAELHVTGSLAALTLEGGATLRDLVLPRIGPVARADLALSATIGRDGIRLAHAGIDSPLGQLFAEGSLAPTLALQLGATLPDLAPLAAAAGRPAAGRATLAGRLTGDAQAQRLSGTIDARDLAIGPALVDRLLGGRLGGSFTVARAADGAIAIEAADLAAANVAVRGSGRLADGHARSDLTVSLPRLALIDPRLEGEATLTLALEDAAGRAQATGTLARQNLAAGARLALDAERLRFDEATVTLGPNRLAGRGAVLLASGLVEGELRILDAEPGSLLAGLGGRASGTVQLAARPDGQAVTADLVGERLAYGGIDVGRARLRLALADALGEPHGTASAELAGVVAGTTRLDRATLALEGGLAGARIALQASGQADARPLQLDLAGTIAARDGGGTARIERLAGHYGDLPVRLRRPLTLESGGSDMAIAGLDLAVGKGSLSGEARLAGARLSGRLALADLDAALLQSLVGAPPLRGTLQATATLDGTLDRPQLALTAAGSDLGRPDGPLHVALQATGTWHDDRLGIKGTVSDQHARPLDFEATLPVTYRARPLAVSLPPDGPLAGRLSGKIDVGQALVAAGQDISASGQATIDLRLAGTVAAPQASGAATLANGRYDDLRSGLTLREVAVELVGDGEQLRVKQLSAGDGRGGRITGGGALQLGQPGLPFQAQVELAHLTVSPMGSAARIDGKLKLSGTVTAARLQGALTVTRADAVVPDRLPASVVQIQVVEINGPPRLAAAAPAAPAAAAPPAIEVTLAVGVELPGQVFVRGRGLDSEWRGRLKIAGTAEAPDLTGKLTLVRGTFSLIGKTFTLREGTITFPGGTRIDPEIELTATAQASDLTATVTVSGSASRPTIALASEPPLPQDEILARVLFGQGISQLSPAQALQLAEAVQTLTGTGGKASGLLTSIRQATGLDTLDVTSDATGGSALKLGKYVGKGFYFSAQQGTSGTSGRAGITYQVTPNISVELSIGATANPEVGATWKWDY